MRPTVLFLTLPLLLPIALRAAQALDSLPLPDYSLTYQALAAATPLSIVAGDGHALTIDRPGRLGQQQLTTQLSEHGWQKTSLDHSMTVPLPLLLQSGPLGKVTRNLSPYAKTGVAMARADDSYNLLREVHYGGGFAYTAGARLGVNFAYDNSLNNGLGGLASAQADRAQTMNVKVTYRF